MNPRPEQPPEGKLIADALERKGISMREAARRARISYGRWRQIVNGYQSAGGGNYVPVTGPPSTVARMAQAVDVTPGQLEDAGRKDAAEALRDLADGDQASSPLSTLTDQELRLVEAFVQALRSGQNQDRSA